MNSAAPARDTSPLRFSWIDDTKDYMNTGEPTRALQAHRSLTGFEAIAVAEWCKEFLGAEGFAWGRTNRYGWWFRDEGRATQFLLVFQCSKPAAILA